MAPPSGGCFPAAGVVRLQGGRRVPLSQLRPGDMVLARDPVSSRLLYSEVLTFLDRDETASRWFLKFRLVNNSTITATEAHLLLREDGTQVFAARVQVGDFLQVPDEQEGVAIGARVVDITRVLEHGVYAPLTRAGTVVVDGALASCYAAINSQRLAHWALAPLRAWLWLTPKHALTEGVHPYVNALHSVARYIFPKSMLYE